ncbi:hypothetical protein NUU61_008559 [Penicillium alfredii]|uniref:Uncharacterized protein n=1 Tax=Penicillium alfredii TaxID=1506179 RepID=A0A9W9ELM7_9EURO|nr:uncharacterized protein NUU61_008559 [Penicillium alfredii]KAJ5083980.1 hypothetical protein NUU61_008559 [Penicillium alfredii]
MLKMSNMSFTASFEFPSTVLPRTPMEWKSVLKDVKVLYLQRQYKQCANRSVELLETAIEPIHPICKTYLFFYAAISYEFLGRAAHIYSRNKISLLRSALDYFVSCGAALPSPIALTAPNTCVPRSPATNPVLFCDGAEELLFESESLVESLTRMIDSSLFFGLDEDPFISDNDSSRSPIKLSPVKQLTNTKDPVKKDRLIPSPLRIRKISGEINVCGLTKANDENDEKTPPTPPKKARGRSRPAPLPLKVVPSNRLNISPAKASPPKASIIAASPPRTASPKRNHAGRMTPTKMTKKPAHDPTKKKNKKKQKTLEPITPARAAAITMFNNSIEFLRAQVISSIASLQVQVVRISEMQRARRARNMRRSASFWSFSPIKNGDHQADAWREEEPTIDQFGNLLWKETKEQRIERLRAEGWMTVGLRSHRSEWKGAEYYQAFCSAVLDEIYLGV